MRRLLIMFDTGSYGSSVKITLPDELLTYDEINNYVISLYGNLWSAWGELNFHLPNWLKENCEMISKMKRL